MKVFMKLSVVAAVTAALVVGVFGAAGSMASSTKASSFTLGIVADTGGLNDHGFNHLAYEGSIEAVNKLGIKKQVLQARQARTTSRSSRRRQRMATSSSSRSASTS